jgi:hypothetical protein
MSIIIVENDSRTTTDSSQEHSRTAYLAAYRQSHKLETAAYNQEHYRTRRELSEQSKPVPVESVPVPAISSTCRQAIPQHCGRDCKATHHTLSDGERWLSSIGRVRYSPTTGRIDLGAM